MHGMTFNDNNIATAFEQLSLHKEGMSEDELKSQIFETAPFKQLVEMAKNETDNFNPRQLAGVMISHSMFLLVVLLECFLSIAKTNPITWLPVSELMPFSHFLPGDMQPRLHEQIQGTHAQKRWWVSAQVKIVS